MAVQAISNHSSSFDKIIERAKYHKITADQPEKHREEHERVFKYMTEILSLRRQICDNQSSLDAALIGSNDQIKSDIPHSAHLDISKSLDRMSSDLSILLDHIEGILDSKEALTSYLQKPLSGDSLTIEYQNHREFHQLLQTISSSLVQLPNQLSLLDWASKFNMKDTELERKLWNISSFLVKCQRYHESLTHLEQLTRAL